MSRAQLAALVGSAAFVLLAFWLVTLMFPARGPVHDIIGKWRPDLVASCSEDIYIKISPNGLARKSADQPELPVMTKVAIIGERGKQQLLVGHESWPLTVKVAVATEVKGDELRFVSAEWTQEALAGHQELKAPPFLGAPAKILQIMQKSQPLHWCGD